MAIRPPRYNAHSTHRHQKNEIIRTSLYIQCSKLPHRERVPHNILLSYFLAPPPPPPPLGPPAPKLVGAAGHPGIVVVGYCCCACPGCCPFKIATFAARIAASLSVLAGGRGYGNDASIDSSVARPAVACACAGDKAEADVGADAGMGGSGGAGMAGAVGVGGRDDGRRGVCCCCVFTLGLVVVDVRCGVLVRRVGGGGKEEDTGDDRDVGV